MSIRTHAIDRAEERYGVRLSLDDLHDIQMQVANGQAIWLGDARDNACIWLVTLPGANKRARALLDRDTLRVITILPVRLKHHDRNWDAAKKRGKRGRPKPRLDVVDNDDAMPDAPLPHETATNSILAERLVAAQKGRST